MNEDGLGRAAAAWLKATDPIAPDAVVSVRRVISQIETTTTRSGTSRWARRPRPTLDGPGSRPSAPGRHRREASSLAAIATMTVAAALVVAVGGTALLAPRDDDRLGATVASPSATAPALESTPQPTDVPSQAPAPPDGEAVSPFGETAVLMRFEPGADPTSLSRGVGGTALLVDRAARTVVEIDRDGYPRVLITGGVIPEEGPGGLTEALHEPSAVTRAGDHVFIVDADGALWIWRQGRHSDTAGYLRESWTYEDEYPSAPAVVAPGTAILAGAWRAARDFDVYSVDPASTLVLHGGNPDDSLRPPRRLVSAEELRHPIVDLYVDERIYALGTDDVTVLEVLSRGITSQDRAFALDVPPGTPVDYRFIDGIVDDRRGPLYLFDAASGKIDLYDRRNGDFLGSLAPGDGQPAMDDVRGMYVEAVDKGHAVVTWATPDALYRSTLSSRPLPEPESAGLLVDSDRESGDRSLVFEDAGISLEADAFRIDVGGRTFRGTGHIALSGYLSPMEGELELQWYERGILSRLRLALVADDSHWWVDEIATYDGVKGDGQYVHYSDLATLTRTPIGESLEGDLDLRSTGADRIRFRKPGSSRLRIDRMRLTAFQPGTIPAALTGCRRIPERDASGRYHPELRRLVSDSGPLAGIDEMTPTEIEAILQGLGVCYTFSLSHPHPEPWDPEVDPRPREARARWCSAPPDSQVDTRQRSGPSPVMFVPDGYSNEPGVIVSIALHSERRDWPKPPPAGWHCPTR